MENWKTKFIATVVRVEDDESCCVLAVELGRRRGEGKNEREAGKAKGGGKKEEQRIGMGIGIG